MQKKKTMERKGKGKDERKERWEKVRGRRVKKKRVREEERDKLSPISHLSRAINTLTNWSFISPLYYATHVW